MKKAIEVFAHAEMVSYAQMAMKLKVIVIVAAITGLIGKAGAQNPPEFPLIADYKQVSKLVGKGDFSVLGIPLHATPEEVDQVLQGGDFSRYTIKHGDQNRGLQDRRGNTVRFSYGRAFTEIKNKSQPFDKIVINYTSGLHGKRVVGISRNRSLEPEADKDGLVSAVIRKYGTPTRATFSNRKQDVTMIYIGGELAIVDGATYEQDKFRRGSPADRVQQCEFRQIDIAGLGRKQYLYKPDRQRKTGVPCNGGIGITLSTGKRNDLISRMQISVWDYDLGFADLKAQDQFMTDQLLKATEQSTGGEAPKL